MPVPNTNTFTLQDVINELAGTQTRLSQCFTAAKDAGFDPTYVGNKDRLSNFRNYNDSLGLFPVVVGQGSSAALACSATATITYYIDTENWNTATVCWVNSDGTGVPPTAWFAPDGPSVNARFLFNGAFGSSVFCGT